MSYEVVLSERAEIYLESIYNWIILNHPANAKKVKDNLISSMMSLSVFPKRGARYRQTEYRFLVSGRFKIVYTLENNQVIILAIE